MVKCTLIPIGMKLTQNVIWKIRRITKLNCFIFLLFYNNSQCSVFAYDLLPRAARGKNEYSPQRLHCIKFSNVAIHVIPVYQLEIENSHFGVFLRTLYKIFIFIFIEIHTFGGQKRKKKQQKRHFL